MARLIYGAQQRALTFPNNEFVALVQTVTHHRFASGRGYFLTLAGTDDSGQDDTTSYWVHPSIPLVFEYDVADDSDNYLPTIEVDQELVARVLRHLDDPLGFVAGFGDEGPNFPFAPPPAAESASSIDQ